MRSARRRRRQGAVGRLGEKQRETRLCHQCVRIARAPDEVLDVLQRRQMREAACVPHGVESDEVAATGQDEADVFVDRPHRVRFGVVADGSDQFGGRERPTGAHDPRESALGDGRRAARLSTNVGHELIGSPLQRQW